MGVKIEKENLILNPGLRYIAKIVRSKKRFISISVCFKRILFNFI